MRGQLILTFASLATEEVSGNLVFVSLVLKSQWKLESDFSSENVKYEK